MSSPGDIQEVLDEAEKELRRLKQADRLAEAAPATFGRLAEDVQAVLDRRQRADRRAARRPTPDRRRSTS
jgi:hypothetical protein